MTVAYMMSRFPKLTETFILYEILAVEQQGVKVSLYPLLRERTSVMHPESVALVERANFAPLLSLPILLANLRFFLRKPGAYLGTLSAIVKGNWGSLRYFGGALGFFPKAVYFAEQMLKEKVTHIHAHFASHPTATAYIIHRLSGIPYSFTAHGSDIHRDRHMLKEKVALAEFVVPISSFNRQVILDECRGQHAAKMIVIHCGVDTQVFHPNGKDLPEGKPLAAGRTAPFTILCIGTLHEVKGQTYLIDACARLAEKGVPFICQFIGDGPDQPALEQQVRELKLEGCVEFLGRKTRAEIAALLGKADVLVAPSVPSRDGRKEGIPVVLMEAMSAGIPVVASRLSGIPELVEDGKEGLLVTPGKPEELAKAIERLAQDTAQWEAFSQASRQKIEREFDLQKNAAQLASLFYKEPVR